MKVASFNGIPLDSSAKEKKTPIPEETDANCEACKGIGKITMLGLDRPVNCPLCFSAETETF